MLDHFTHAGPNGSHNCLVLELLGPSVADYLDGGTNRLPGNVAKRIAKDTLLGLQYLHKKGVAHGGMLSPGSYLILMLIFMTDLYAANLAFEAPPMHGKSEEEFLVALFGEPVIGAITRIDGEPLELCKPKYLVTCVQRKWDPDLLTFPTKIVDFGEAFTNQDKVTSVTTPLVMTAPEIIFEDELDYRVDLWSFGCLVSVCSCLKISSTNHKSSFSSLLPGNPFSSRTHREKSSMTTWN
jgi:serine/threonine-protein kinase SRPK3